MKPVIPILAISLLAACQPSGTTTTIVEMSGGAKSFMSDSADFTRRFPEIETINYKTKMVNGKMEDGFRLLVIYNDKKTSRSADAIADSVLAYIGRDPYFDKKERYVVEISNVPGGISEAGE